jgi:hypothetical protein
MLASLCPGGAKMVCGISPALVPWIVVFPMSLNQALPPNLPLELRLMLPYTTEICTFFGNTTHRSSLSMLD